MINLTKFSLKRPVTLLLALLTVLFFGLQAIFSAPMELTPDMNMPMLVVASTYIGASPEDINELVTKPLEAAVSTQAGIDTVTSSSMENAAMVILQYKYGTNMDTAYLNLRKSLDIVRNQLPEDAGDPTIYELDINATPVMMVAIMGGSDQNLYNYVNDNIVPEIEKIAAVGDVSVSGGQESYIRIELIPEKMAQYNLTMTTVAQLVGAADYSVPAGEIGYGEQNLNITVSADYKDIEKIRNIVLPLQTGDVIHLSDVAKVENVLEDKTSLSRYNKQDVVTISVSKQQSASAVDVSKSVIKALANLSDENETLNYHVVYDSSDNIKSAITTVFETLAIAVVLAMIVLFIFFGDIKASLIVGSSIPVSVLVTLTFMGWAGFSLNIVSVGSLALGVGMVVDNSIVVVESCFRSKEKNDFKAAAVDGTKTVIGSILGSTLTTCVVFLPLALLKGLTGQIFSQLGFTIVFCMVASFFAAVTIVPLLYFWTKPVEKTETKFSIFMAKVQDGYRNVVRWIIPQRGKVIIVSVFLLVMSFVMAIQLGFELMPSIDEGIVDVTVSMKPGLNIEEQDKILTLVEQYVSEDADVDEYLLSSGGSGLSIMGGSSSGITAYLKKGRKRKTDQVIKNWREDLSHITDATIQVSNSSSIGLNLLQSSGISISLESTDYDLLKKTTDEITDRLKNEPYLMQVHSNMENAAPVVKVTVDPVKAEAYGLTPITVGSQVYMNISGSNVMTYTSNGSEINVKLKNPEGLYDTVEGVKSMLIPTMAGTVVPLSDIAEISFEDSARTITRTNKQYDASITGVIQDGYEDTAQDMADKFVKEYGLPNGVNLRTNSYQEIIDEELGGLLSAIITAIFLVFVVMAMQFESPKLSLMVMFTIPFSAIGAFGLMFACNVKISMVPMIGFLMLVGTVVNNGILYVDTVNQYREEMPLNEALVEAGATRIRPMLMTTLTTVLAMIPMSLAIGNAGELMQGLALVNIGGLVASTLLTLLLLPTVYMMLDSKKKKEAV